MKIQKENQETDKYGNVTFGEASKLLIDIIGQNVILDTMRDKKERKTYQRNMERMYMGQAVYQKLATAEPESPQWYVEQFFVDLENKYNLSQLAMIIVDSFIWQLFYAIRSYTPFEKPKKETALFLLRKEIFGFIYLTLIKGEPLSDGSVFKISGDSIITFLTDSYDKIFSEIESDVNKVFADYKQNITNWRNEDVYNPTWKVLKPILDFLLEKGKTTHIHRLIGLYLRKNAQRAMKDILDISDEEQEKIITDLVTMIVGNKKPEEFYTENIFEFFEQMNLIWTCLVYQYQEDFDAAKSDEIIKSIENKCDISKKFFSPWLKARAKIFETGETLKENKEVQESIIKRYKKAYDEGIYYAGEYLGQFLLEAIIINRFCNPEQVKYTNDYHGYGYAIEIFGPDKQKLLDLIKETDNLQMLFVNILYSDFSPNGKIVSQIFPFLHSIPEFQKEAILKNNKGLEFDKTGNYEIAIWYFKKALLLNPVYVNAYSSRGNVYSKMGEQFTESALVDFNMAILIDPKHENTLFWRGRLLFKNGQFENAIKDFTEVVNINSKAIDAYFWRGNCYTYMKNFDRAIKDYSKAIEINPHYVEAYYNRGAVYKLLGNNDKAQEDYCKAMQIVRNFS